MWTCSSNDCQSVTNHCWEFSLSLNATLIGFVFFQLGSSSKKKKKVLKLFDSCCAWIWTTKKRIFCIHHEHKGAQFKFQELPSELNGRSWVLSFVIWNEINIATWPISFIGYILNSSYTKAYNYYFHLHLKGFEAAFTWNPVKVGNEMKLLGWSVLGSGWSLRGGAVNFTADELFNRVQDTGV